MGKALESSASAASFALTSALSSNFILSLVLGISMKKIWTMISSLQIIVHYPMLKIPLPSNILLMLNSIVEIVNLSLVPKEYITDFIS